MKAELHRRKFEKKLRKQVIHSVLKIVQPLFDLP